MAGGVGGTEAGIPTVVVFNYKKKGGYMPCGRTGIFGRFIPVSVTAQSVIDTNSVRRGISLYPLSIIFYRM